MRGPSTITSLNKNMDMFSTGGVTGPEMFYEPARHFIICSHIAADSLIVKLASAGQHRWM
eukprot:3230846-Heterocapsa_arctica.AAC.1